MATPTIKVRLLGTGGPRPDPQRSGPATLVTVGDEPVLFDAGRGVVIQMLRAGIPLQALRHVFVTHHHFDHIGDLYDVGLSSWFRRATRGADDPRPAGHQAPVAGAADAGV